MHMIQLISYGLCSLVVLTLFFKSPRSAFWFLLLLSPAFILIYPFYMGHLPSMSVIIGLWALSLMALGSIQPNTRTAWWSLSFALFSISAVFYPLTIFYLAFFFFLIGRRSRFWLALFFIASTVSVSIHWELLRSMNATFFKQSFSFYISFMLVLILSWLPIYLTNWWRGKFFFLIGSFFYFMYPLMLGTDWGERLFLYTSLIFIILLRDIAVQQQPIRNKPLPFFIIIIYYMLTYRLSIFNILFIFFSKLRVVIQ